VSQVEISFGRSSSANYERAVDISKKIPTYQQEGEGSSITHKVTLPITEVELLINLYELVGSWKSSRMLINGQSATKSALVYKGVGCYHERQKAYNKDQYCFGERPYEFNIWGCKRLGMPVTEWGGGWLDHGAFDRQGVWHFDKERIRHELELEIREHELCPVLNRKRIMETLAQLPDSINPKTDKNWEYRTSYQEINGEYKEVAVGIRPVLKQANAYVIGSFRPEWKGEELSSSGASQAEVRITTNDLPRVATAEQRKLPRKSSSCLGTLLAIVGVLGLCIAGIVFFWP